MAPDGHAEGRPLGRRPAGSSARTPPRDDVAARSRADSRPWRPIPPGSGHSPFAVAGSSDEAACFSVVELDSQELSGEALLWGIDTHNRTAHIGIALRPVFRVHGLGVDVLHTLCAYGFAVRGLQRPQIDTLTDNTPMLAAAAKVPPACTTHTRTKPSSACSPTHGRPGYEQREPRPRGRDVDG
ncbi:GNAT family N-acetyltransferase [Streptomyces sp. NPDC001380]|uniref:GNAT family N-acetyltransferase n=1 Tax=Streptomyces sp. NPDC001380 TaxID=3364566 RepID=UPI00369918CC